MSGRDEKLASISTDDSKIEKIASGFQFVEGPVWNGTGDFLLFSNIPANRVYKWSPEEGLEVFREPSGNSNGLTYDKQMRFIVCEHGNRRLSRTEKDGSITVLADRFQGKRLNSPNDVAVKSDGAIYFTDPPYGIKPDEQELLFQGVFRLDPEDKELTLLADDFVRPNGLAFSPDEKVLYIGDSSDRRQVRAFDVESDGTLSNGHIFAGIHPNLQGSPDGLKADVEGSLYVSAAGGIWVYSKDGEYLGKIEMPETPANCAWGGEDWKTLYATARTSVYRIKLRVSGVKVP
ncbi:MAG: SMP-30/gluconolactonase/LRE family protein [Candidatus Bathyarchaeota archaeon]|nr:SMP-30/gluconolactonase/LRE family protein [Candidatus Bathyarchaeota archaeon]